MIQSTSDMGELEPSRFAGVGFDAVALKPTERRLDPAPDLGVDALVVDFEGHEHVPDLAVLRAMADGHDVRATAPVRADGFDPLGEDDALSALPTDVGAVLVAGNGAFLDEHERRRAVAPRLRAAAERADDPWIGTEGVERLAMAVGGTQFDVLAPTTEREVRALRAAGFERTVAVYAPFVLTADDDAVLDALGDYVARRDPVGGRLSADDPTDATATGRVRETLLAACRDYALVGGPERVRERVDALREAGVDRVVGYPARGLAAVA